MLTIYFMSQHLLVFGIMTFIEAITLHLFHDAPLGPSQVLQLEYLDLQGSFDPCLRE